MNSPAPARFQWIRFTDTDGAFDARVALIDHDGVNATVLGTGEVVQPCDFGPVVNAPMQWLEDREQEVAFSLTGAHLARARDMSAATGDELIDCALTLHEAVNPWRNGDDRDGLELDLGVEKSTGDAD